MDDGSNERFTPVSGGPVDHPLHPRAIAEHNEWLQEPIDAVPTPLPSWNEVCGDDGGREGLAREWFVLIGGPTGAGKTLLSLNVAAHAIKEGTSVGYIKLEMSKHQIRSRMYAILTGKDTKYFERRGGKGGGIHPKGREALEETLAKIPGGTSLKVNDYKLRERRLAIGEMANWAQMHDFRFFVVDFVQRVRAPEESNLRDKFQRVGQDLADFAEQEEVTVIGVSQLRNEAGRAIAKGDRGPVVNDLYGGMGLAQEANQILLLDPSEYERVVHPSRGDRMANTRVLVAKNRHGDEPEIPIQWNYRSLSVRERYPDEH